MPVGATDSSAYGGSPKKHALCVNDLCGLRSRPAYAGGDAARNCLLGISGEDSVNFIEDGLPGRSGVNEHREDLPDGAGLVDQIGRRSVVPFGLLASQVGHDVERRARTEMPQKLAVRFQICVFLRNGYDRGIAFLKLVVHLLQLNQLRLTERSPVCAVGGDDDVFLPEVLAQRHLRTVGPGKREGGGFVSDLQPLSLAPV